MAKITVTQEDINNGTRSSPWSCPIACAVQRTFKKKCRVFPHEIIIELSRDGNLVTSSHKIAPQSVHDFIVLFDNRRPVQPFEFEL